MPVPPVGAFTAQISQTVSRIADLLRIDLAVAAQRAVQVAGVLVLAWALFRGLKGKQWEVGRELRRRLKNRFDREGIEIPFPQRTLHLGGGDALLQLFAARSDKSSATRR